MQSINVILDHKSLSVDILFLKKFAARLLAHEGIKNRGVNIILSSNGLLKRLNNRFRKKDKPTDVLSFEFHETGFLGEIYISLDKAKTQAREYGASFEDEVKRLLTHGLLHLLGHTHYRKAERIKMEKKEKVFLGSSPKPNNKQGSSF